MKRSLGVLLIGLMLAACTGAQTPFAERELEVETITVSEVYGSPPKVAVVLEVQLGACELLETQQLFIGETKTFRIEVVGFDRGSVDAECTEVRAYTETVILEAFTDSGRYNVVAGGKRAGFTVPAAYEPETVAAAIESVDVVLRETDPVQVVVYVNGYYGGCDDAFKTASQRREGDTFFVAVRVLAPEPPEVPVCPPVAFPFTEPVVLETVGLAPGTYTVDVNGVVKRFQLP